MYFCAYCILAICVVCFLYLCICVPSKIGGIRREWRNRCCRQAEAFLISWADLQTCLLYLYLYLSLYLQTDNSTPDQFSIFANMPVLPTKNSEEYYRCKKGPVNCFRSDTLCNTLRQVYGPDAFCWVSRIGWQVWSSFTIVLLVKSENKQWDIGTVQGCISCGTCSYPELTEDHVLTSAYVKIFRTVTRNAVNKSVWRKKDCSWPPLNKYAMNIIFGNRMTKLTL